MKIAVLSDSHDHLDHLAAVLPAVAEEKAEHLLHGRQQLPPRHRG